MSNIHPYDNKSNIYNFFFHPLHAKQRVSKALSVITNIFMSVMTAGIWQVPFWVINRLDHRKLEKWKKEQASDVDNVASNTFSQTTAPKPETPPQDTPSGGPSVQPSDSTVPPGDSTVPPIDDSTTVPPGGSSVPPVDSTTVPPNGSSTVPSGDSTVPPGGTPAPVGKDEVVDPRKDRIPIEVKRSLEELFGCPKVIEKLPILENLDSEGKKALEFDFPVMMALDPHGTPLVILKVVTADPEGYYEKYEKKDREESWRNVAEQRGMLDQFEEIKKQGAQRTIEKIKTQPHLIILGQTYFDGSRFSWCETEHYHEDREPNFFSKNKIESNAITFNDTGGLTPQARELLPSFQALFKNGLAADIQGNRWKMVDHNKVKARFFSKGV